MPDKEQIEAIADGDYSTVTKMLSGGVCVKSCPTGNSTIPVECFPTNAVTSDFKYKECVYYPLAT